MHKRSRKRGKPETISHSEEGAQIYRSGLRIRRTVKFKLGINDAQNIIRGTIRREKVARIYWELLGIVEIKKVRDGCHHIHDKKKPNGNIGSGKPWAS